MLETDKDFREYLGRLSGCTWLIEYNVVVDSVATDYVVWMQRTATTWEILSWTADGKPGSIPMPQCLREYLMTDDSMVFGSSKFPPSELRGEVGARSRKWFKIDHQLRSRKFTGRDHLELNLLLDEYVRGNVWHVECETKECHHLATLRLPADPREVDLAVREVRSGEACDACGLFGDITAGFEKRSC